MKTGFRILVGLLATFAATAYADEPMSPLEIRSCDIAISTFAEHNDNMREIVEPVANAIMRENTAELHSILNGVSSRQRSILQTSFQMIRSIDSTRQALIERRDLLDRAYRARILYDQSLSPAPMSDLQLRLQRARGGLADARAELEQHRSELNCLRGRSARCCNGSSDYEIRSRIELTMSLIRIARTNVENHQREVLDIQAEINLARAARPTRLREWRQLAREAGISPSLTAEAVHALSQEVIADISEQNSWRNSTVAAIASNMSALSALLPADWANELNRADVVYYNTRSQSQYGEPSFRMTFGDNRRLPAGTLARCVTNRSGGNGLWEYVRRAGLSFSSAQITGINVCSYVHLNDDSTEITHHMVWMIDERRDVNLFSANLNAPCLSRFRASGAGEAPVVGPWVLMDEYLNRVLSDL